MSPAKMRKNSTDYRYSAKKRFGQNFLVDSLVVEDIIRASDLSGEDIVLEIGPGHGALTGEIQKRVKKLIAVEIDRDLVRELRQSFLLQDNIEIIEGDILKENIPSLLFKEKNVKIIANLPYYITTPIVMKLLEEEIDYQSIVVMVQREVALRMCASADKGDYGALSLAVDFYTRPAIVRDVPASCFRPVPKVDSCVVKLEKKSPICQGREKELLFKCIRAAFFQRRKTFVNAISAARLASKEDIRNILKELELGENIRGEALSLEKFYLFSKKLGEKNGYQTISR